jgi:hypothetical protein
MLAQGSVSLAVRLLWSARNSGFFADDEKADSNSEPDFLPPVPACSVLLQTRQHIQRCALAGYVWQTPDEVHFKQKNSVFSIVGMKRMTGI